MIALSTLKRIAYSRCLVSFAEIWVGTLLWDRLLNLFCSCQWLTNCKQYFLLQADVCWQSTSLGYWSLPAILQVGVVSHFVPVGKGSWLMIQVWCLLLLHKVNWPQTIFLFHGRYSATEHPYVSACLLTWNPLLIWWWIEPIASSWHVDVSLHLVQDLGLRLVQDSNVNCHDFTGTEASISVLEFWMMAACEHPPWECLHDRSTTTSLMWSIYWSGPFIDPELGRRLSFMTFDIVYMSLRSAYVYCTSSKFTLWLQASIWTVSRDSIKLLTNKQQRSSNTLPATFLAALIASEAPKHAIAPQTVADEHMSRWLSLWLRNIRLNLFYRGR